MRRLPLLSLLAACAVPLVPLLAQGVDALPVHFDLADVLAKVVYGAAGLVGTALLWLAKQGLDTLNRLDGKVTKISHELFGPEGTNGMRSDLKETKKHVKQHGRVLAVLADREGIPFHEDDE